MSEDKIKLEEVLEDPYHQSPRLSVKLIEDGMKDEDFFGLATAGISAVYLAVMSLVTLIVLVGAVLLMVPVALVGFVIGKILQIGYKMVNRHDED